MDDGQNDELTMLEDVQAYFTIPANLTKITTVADLLAGKVELDGHITYIHQNNAIASADTTGLRGNKDHMRGLVTSEILDLAGPLANLGRHNHDSVLIEKYNIKKYILDGKTGNDLITFSGNTQADATANILALASAGVTPAMVTLLNTDTAALSLILTSPTAAKQAKKVANANITARFPQTRELFDLTLKPLMRTNFNNPDPDFYKNFLTATQIISTGIHHLDFFGLIINTIDGHAVISATITLIPDALTTKPPIVTAKAGKKGHFLFKVVPQGTYTVEISCPGFKTLTVPGVVVIKGISTKKTFSLVPL